MNKLNDGRTIFQYPSPFLHTITSKSRNESEPDIPISKSEQYAIRINVWDVMSQGETAYTLIPTIAYVAYHIPPVFLCSGGKNGAASRATQRMMRKTIAEFHALKGLFKSGLE